jgi:oligopeptide transport system ATP-binding protein
METHDTFLSVQHISKTFPVKRTISDMIRRETKLIRAVDDVSLEVAQGSTFGLVGESGSGKTTIGKLILRLYAPISGHIIFRGTDIHQDISRSKTKTLRREIQAVFQDPAASLDPRMTVTQIVREPLQIHRICDGFSQQRSTLEALEAVGLQQEFHERYPHELSGGQQQRVAIARALVLHPKLVILDEPVSALDMSVRTQVLNLLKELQAEHNLTYLFVSHDLSVIRYLCDRVAVMYLGRIVENCETRELFENPLHPYTKALLQAVPVPDPSRHKVHEPLAGSVPSPIDVPSGCSFHPRCPHVMDVCVKTEPDLVEVSKGHWVACYLNLRNKYPVFRS